MFKTLFTLCAIVDPFELVLNFVFWSFDIVSNFRYCCHREVKNMYIPLRIIFTGLLFYAAYRFGKAVGKEEPKQLTESKKE